MFSSIVPGTSSGQKIVRVEWCRQNADPLGN
jgi:hypothetical protein